MNQEVNIRDESRSLMEESRLSSLYIEKNKILEKPFVVFRKKLMQRVSKLNAQISSIEFARHKRLLAASQGESTESILQEIRDQKKILKLSGKMDDEVD